MIKTQLIEYYDGNILLEGYVAFKEDGKEKPLVLVAHDWSGKNDFAKDKANALAELGYVGFAVDMFGKGILGETKEEKTALIQPLLSARSSIATRMKAGMDAALSLKGVSHHKIAAIGFCFGGLCALDLARSDSRLSAAVSFHGLLFPPDHQENQDINAKILVLHGYDDPMVQSDQMLAFCQEMEQAHADWQLTLYGNTMHAFMNPLANDPGFGTVYNPQTEVRAWLSMKNFLAEVFS